MLDLLLATLEMMGLTFAIGFFVALVIKLIATAADSFDFYSSHQKELLRLRRLKKLRQNVESLIRHTSVSEEELISDGREDFSRGINREKGDSRGYYHGVSLGSSKMNLVDYYYPDEDTHLMYLEDAITHRKNKNKAQKSPDNKKTK